MKSALSRGAVVAALIAGVAWVAGAWILGRSFVRGRNSDEIIRVVGSARRPIRSDFIIWRGKVTRTAPQMARAYALLESDMAKVTAYLRSKGIPPKEIFPQAISTTTLYQRVANQSGSTEDSSTFRPVAGYQLAQDIEVRSYKIELLDDLSRQSSELISRGVPFESQSPLYIYTKLSDLKVTMQAEAAKDARARARHRRSSGCRPGRSALGAHDGAFAHAALFGQRQRRRRGRHHRARKENHSHRHHRLRREMSITLPITVVAFETDFGGVVSNTRHVEYVERGRYALLHAAGLKISEVWDSHGVQPVVHRLDIEYLGFARHEDELLLRVRVEAHGGATTTLCHELSRSSDSLLLMRATQTLAYLNRQWKPTRVPALFRDTLPIQDKHQDTKAPRA